MVCLLAQCATAAPSCSTAEFEAWATAHGHDRLVKYHNAERELRHEAFCNSSAVVEAHNKRYAAGETSYWMKLHEYSANTKEEWSRMMGTKLSEPAAEATKYCSPPHPRVTKTVAASAVDWRAEGKVTGIKNQGQCGSCWSFSAIGAMEGAVAIAQGFKCNGTNPNEGYSEDQCLSCTPGTMGCSGGFPWLCFKHIIDNGGIDSEQDWPYLSEGGCDAAKEKLEKVAMIASCSNITDGDEAGLRQALTVTPVSVAIAAQCDSFMHYGG